MTSAADIAAFSARIRSCIDEFRQHETVLRAQYTRDSAGAAPVATQQLLERSTRRFLIDRYLRALDWNPDDPSVVIEEARSFSGTDRLYFDYMGVSREEQTPVLIVEAKGLDISPPKKSRTTTVNAKDMASFLAREIGILKGEQGLSQATAEWKEYLTDLRTYVQSLDALGRSTLQRLVITSGKWLVVFSAPVRAFCEAGPVSPELIQCFSDEDDVLQRVEEIHDLLHRSRLVDHLRLTLATDEALRWIRPQHIDGCFRAVLVATSASSGAQRKRYPTRTVYPALILRAGGRLFVVVDYGGRLEEPDDADHIAAFLAQLTTRGEALERRLSAFYGACIAPQDIDQFPGFASRSPRALPFVAQPVAGSTVARLATSPSDSRIYLTPSGEPGAESEYVVVTGASWFYKRDVPSGPACNFHFWKDARSESVASDAGPLMDTNPASFTLDGQGGHCAHGDHRAFRRARCHVIELESHMCCRACIFENTCWAPDAPELPCPSN